MIDLLLNNAIIENSDQPVDIAIHNGMIIDLGPQLDYSPHQQLDIKRRLVIPGFVESHLHLDIALMNSWQQPGRPEPYLSHYGLNDSMERRRKKFTPLDIEQRAGMTLELASKHGVTAVRAQCHVDPEIGLKQVEALQSVKEKYSGRVTLQIATFPQQGLLKSPQIIDLFKEAFKIGADVMGGASNLDRDTHGNINVEAHLDAAFDLAMEFDIDLDIHADLGLPDTVTLDELEVVCIAKKTIERNYQGRVTVGHACALDSALPDVAAQAISLIKEAKLNIVSQPDLYRLAREDTHHVRRGLTWAMSEMPFVH